MKRHNKKNSRGSFGSNHFVVKHIGNKCFVKTNADLTEFYVYISIIFKVSYGHHLKGILCLNEFFQKHPTIKLENKLKNNKKLYLRIF